MAGNEQVFAATPIRTAGQRIIASPFEFFSTGEDNIRIIGVNSLSNVTLQIQGRMVDTDGTILPLRETLALTANRVVASKDIPLGKGAMMNLVVFASGATPLIGQTYVIAQLIRGMGTAAIVLGTLCADYVTSTQPIAWPGTGVKSSIEGGGYPRTIFGTTPGAGLEVNEVVPAGARWKLRAFTAAYTTSGAGGNRCVQLAVFNAAAPKVSVGSPVNQGPGVAWEYVWGQGLINATRADGALYTNAWPQDLPLLAGETIQTQRTFGGAGDQWSTVRYVVDEWLEAA